MNVFVHWINENGGALIYRYAYVSLILFLAYMQSQKLPLLRLLIRPFFLV